MAKGWKFTDNSKQVYQQLVQATEGAVEAACLVVESQAKALAPVDNGQLRDTLDHRVFKDNGITVGQVGSPLEYAPYVEYGTGEFAENGAGRKGGWSYQTPDGKWHHTMGNKPQPFLRPAFRANKQNIEQILGTELSSKFPGK